MPHGILPHMKSKIPKIYGSRRQNCADMDSKADLIFMEKAVLRADRLCLRPQFPRCFSALDPSCRGHRGKEVRDPLVH